MLPLLWGIQIMSLPSIKPRLQFTVDQLKIMVNFAKALDLKELRIIDSKIYQYLHEGKDKKTSSPLLVADFSPVLGSFINFHVNVKAWEKLMVKFGDTKETSVIIEEQADSYTIINRKSDPSSHAANEVNLMDRKLEKLSTQQDPVYKLTFNKESFNRVCEPFCLKKEKISTLKSYQRKLNNAPKTINQITVKGKLKNNVKQHAIGFIINGYKLIALGLGVYNGNSHDYEMMMPPFNTPLPYQNKPADLILMSHYSAPLKFGLDADIKLIIQHNDNNSQAYWMFTKVDFNGVIIDIIEPLEKVFMQNRRRSENEIISTLSKLVG